jgi:hypothetical protein
MRFDGVVMNRRGVLLSGGAVFLPVGMPPWDDQSGGVHPGPVADSVAAGWRDFHAGAYEKVGARLPGIVRACRSLDGAGASAYSRAVAARGYILASETLSKSGAVAPCVSLSSQAVRAAEGAGDLALAASASRSLSTAWRRQGSAGAAGESLLGMVAVASDLSGGTPSERAVYTRLLCTTAYTHACAGDAGRARDISDEALSVAARPGAAAGALEHARVYRVGVEWAAGDAAGAVRAVGAVRPWLLPTRERRARFWADAARAYQLADDRVRCLQALRVAYDEAAEEVVGRPSMRAVVSWVASGARGSADGRGFARRVGVGVG